MYKTDFYEVRTTDAGEVRFGPEYKFVKVYSKGVEIWDGGKNIYGAESFQHNVIGEKYNKLILIRWFFESDPCEQTVVEIDLATGTETRLDMNQRYWEAGHFNSFDGVFYRKSHIKDDLCKDFGTRTEFLLFERIREKIDKAFDWSVTAVKDCILVYAQTMRDNVALYNVRKQEVVEFMTLDIPLTERTAIFSRLDKRNNEVIVRCHDSLGDGKSGIEAGYDFYKIRFQ